MPTNTSIVLDSRPEGQLEPRHFRFVDAPAPEPGEGQVLVRHLFLSLDPYMRGRMSAGRSYAAPQELGATMGGGTVGEVVASKHPGFAVGDHVVGMGGWQLYALSDGVDLHKIDGTRIPLSCYLGVAGMPGVTAWYGVHKILQPKRGETVVVSAATGAVGSVVGQLVAAAGVRAVGIAGGPAKCAYAVETLGYAACVDHTAPDFQERLAADLPHGLDALFENVGGAPFVSALDRVNPFARVAICGLIASYQGAPTALPNMRVFLTARISVTGFIVSDHMDLWPEAIGELASMVASGRLAYRETIAQGLHAAPEAMIGLLAGKNFGKQLVALT